MSDVWTLDSPNLTVHLRSALGEDGGALVPVYARDEPAVRKALCAAPRKPGKAARNDMPVATWYISSRR